MPVALVEGQGEEAPGAPLEAVPAPARRLDGGRAAPAKHVDHLLEEVALRLGPSARRELADVGVHEDRFALIGKKRDAVDLHPLQSAGRHQG